MSTMHPPVRRENPEVSSGMLKCGKAKPRRAKNGISTYPPTLVPLDEILSVVSLDPSLGVQGIMHAGGCSKYSNISAGALF